MMSRSIARVLGSDRPSFLRRRDRRLRIGAHMIFALVYLALLAVVMAPETFWVGL